MTEPYKPQLNERVLFQKDGLWNTGVCSGHCRSKDSLVYIRPDNLQGTSVLIWIGHIKEISYWKP